MKRGLSTRVVAALIILNTILIGYPPSTVTTNFRDGPFVDTIVFDVISQESKAIQALMDDDIQIIGDTIDSKHRAELEQAEFIEIAEVLRNGYGYLTINCDKYPFNLTSFRRAFAFAIDKQEICSRACDGYAYPQDSLVPKVNPFSIEDDMPYHYYTPDIRYATQILEQAGFEDIDDDSYREAPNGEDFHVSIEVALSSEIALTIGEIAEDALEAIDINATSKPTDFYEYLNRLYFHDDYDVAFVGYSFNDFSVEWLAYEYWSEYADEQYYNFPNFRNSTYDSWRNQLLNATEYEEVHQAAAEMQKIWIYQSPMIICYEDYDISAYRTDRFEGFVNQAAWGPFSFWSAFHTHLQNHQNDIMTGELHWSCPLDPDTFSVFDQYYPGDELLYSLLYESLMRIGPDGRAIHWLAKSHKVETHEDNKEVPSGHTRFTFELVRNATWIDGKPLTADDVAFSFNYYRDNPGNPLGSDLGSMTAAYAPDPYTAIIEFSTTSYWLLHTIGYKSIIPKHIFEDTPHVSWNKWNPDPREEPMVTSGPYNISAYIPGEYTEYSRNPNYFYQYMPNDINNTTPENPIFPFFNPLVTGIAVACTIIFVGTGILWIRSGRYKNHLES